MGTSNVKVREMGAEIFISIMFIWIVWATIHFMVTKNFIMFIIGSVLIVLYIKIFYDIYKINKKIRRSSNPNDNFKS
jgi:hypothetical protein